MVVIDTDPRKTTEAGGWWWDVAVPEVSDRPQVNAALLADEYPNDFARIIGLHTYSQSPHRDYDIQLTGNWVERGGFRFEDFVLTRRREEENGNH